MPRRSARHCDRHITERALLRFGERPDPLGDAFESRTIVDRQSGAGTIERGAIEKQRIACRHVSKALRVFAHRGFAPRADGVDDRPADRQRFRRDGLGPPLHELGDGARTQQTPAHDLLAIGRRVTARCLRASSARTSASVPPPCANATSAM